jgi:glyoxylase-like metal-dependent hydrolase (beta-lactamase superfamily II)
VAVDDALSLDAGGDQDFVPDVTVGHGDVIEGPGWTFEAVFTPGHTSNHLSFALREENALFSGDHVMAWSTSVVAPPDGHMGDYMASLDTVLARAEEIYWPTHGPAVTRPQRFVTKLAQHRRAREAMILARLKAGDRTIAEMLPIMYAGLDPRLVPAASLSMLAHVVDLIEREAVETDGPVSMGGSFRLR